MGIICDFCASPDVRWSYPARDFDVPEAYSTSVGPWAACPICHALIARGDRRALLRRSADTGGIGLRGVKVLQRIHHGFFTHREGPPQELC